MEAPTMFGPQTVAPDTTAIVSYSPLPGLGLLPVNSFVIHAAEPVLVDTGLPMLKDEYMKALGAVIDPADLRWIWLSHMDADHLGSLEAIQALAPKAKIVTNFLGMAKMMLRSFDVSQVHLLEPGGHIDAGDRKLVPLKPAYFDAPETVGFFDTKTRVLFSADAFGCLMQETAAEAADIPEEAMFDGMAPWAAIDAPWLGMVDRQVFGRVLADIERLDPSAIIAGHLPVARGVTKRVLASVDAAVGGGRIAAPDRETIEALLAGAPPPALAA